MWQRCKISVTPEMPRLPQRLTPERTLGESGLKDRPVHKEHKEHKELPVHREQQDRLDHREQPEQQDRKDRKVQPVLAT